MRRPIGAAVVALSLCLSPPAVAQEDAGLAAMASWTALDVAPGYETRSAAALLAQMPGWTADRYGNLIMRVGEGQPRQVVACMFDRAALAVTQVTDEGYLRVHRIGRGSRHPLWDQAFEAQQVRVLTRRGPVAGVVARSNGHFDYQHRAETAVVTADELWVDVGAESAPQVAAMGIELLDPIVRHLPAWTIAGAVAGPAAGSRVGCGAVATLAAAAATRETAGETWFVLAAQSGFGSIGLSSLVARAEPFERAVVLSAGQAAAVDEPVAVDALGRAGAVFAANGLEQVHVIAPEVRAAGAHMEVISAAAAQRLLRAAAGAIGLPDELAMHWVAAPVPATLVADHEEPGPGAIAGVLEDLVELHGVSGHEWAVRRYVLEALPDWARRRAVVDDIGNIVVTAGPEGEATVFMAHLDEVGYTVAAIAEDGTVSLDTAGGPVSSAWEGQTAMLHFAPEGAPSTGTGTGNDTDARWKEQSLRAVAMPPLRGVFLTRASAQDKRPDELRAWFGLDRAALEQRGVAAGLAVTSYKEGLRLGPYRFSGRGLDDRAGTTALLAAINAIDPEALPGRVVFAWSVHEEGGLIGAGAIARRLGAATRRIYSVDTFVSSDTPLESPHFAYAPLGAGPVLRAIESSGVSPDAERDRVRELATGAGIPLQIGLTQGGTDGTWFTYWGAPNQGLSWPGRYSHSPGEVLDLRDLERLAELIVAVIRAGP